MFALLCIVFFVIQNLIFIVHPDRTGFYMNTCTDLWDHYVCVLGGRNLSLGMYPPLAALIYRCYAAMIPESFFSMGWMGIAYTNAGSYITLLYYLFSIVPFCLLCYDSIEGKKGEKVLILAALCCSTPFLFSLMRGNIIVLSFCAAFYFCCSLKSENTFARITGIVSLFVAIGIKLYPVAFAALLIKEHRWRELKALIGLIAILSVVFLSFFNGFLSEVFSLVRGIMRFTENFAEYQNLSLKRQVWDVFVLLGLPQYAVLFSIVNLLILISYLCTSAILFFLTKKRWVALLLLSLSCLLIPGISRAYTEIFLIIPLIEMLNCRDKDIFRSLSLLILLPVMLCSSTLSDFLSFHAGIFTFPLFFLCVAEVLVERRKIKLPAGVGKFQN